MSDTKEVITFKVDSTISNLLKGIQNRSEFIRSAILAALDSVCPCCKGTGVLTPNQKKHWNQLSPHVEMQECHECKETVLVAKTPDKI